MSSQTYRDVSWTRWFEPFLAISVHRVRAALNCWTPHALEITDAFHASFAWFQLQTIYILTERFNKQIFHLINSKNHKSKLLTFKHEKHDAVACFYVVHEHVYHVILNNRVLDFRCWKYFVIDVGVRETNFNRMIDVRDVRRRYFLIVEHYRAELV
jgi:hypothetical protein